MTDRELLELAAKAAGMKFLPAKFDDSAPFLVYDGGGYENDRYWNPLTDDGDALRLAVKLEIRIDISSTASAAYPTKHDAVLQHSCGDPYAATRRAIVRAAAEIGRAM